jgi:O-antigen/teichoic acid export membrane protein
VHDASIGGGSTGPPSAGLRQTVSRGAAAALVLRAGGMGLAVIAGILLARTLGPSGYGAYSWSFAWATTLAAPAALGADQLLAREAGVEVDRGHWGALRALLRSALGTVVAVSLCVVVVCGLVTLAIGRDELGARHTALLVALPILPLTAVAAVAQGVLVGLGRTANALWPGTLGRQGSLVLLVVIATAAGGLSATDAVGLQLVASAVACVVVLLLVRRALARLPAAEGSVGVRRGEWLRVSLLMGGAALFLVVDAQVGLLVVGAAGSDVDAGVYAAALQCLAPFVLVQAAGRVALTSTVARLGAAGERERLQRGLRIATRGVAAVAAAAALVLILVPSEVLGLFGEGFDGGASVLRILAVAYLVNSLCAFNGMVLIVRGEERVAMVAALACLVLDVVLCLVLVPPFGARGAAVAVLVTVTARNVFNSWSTWRRLGLDTTVLGRNAQRL